MANIFAPYLAEPPPEVFVRMVADMKYKKGWTFTIRGQILQVVIEAPDSTGDYERRVERNRMVRWEPFSQGDVFDTASWNPRPYATQHNIPIPTDFPEIINTPENCREWLIRTIIKIETHEACEFFKLPAGDVHFHTDVILNAYAIRDGYYAPFFPHSDRDPFQRDVYQVIDKTPY